jgi:hypothetical protein
VIPKDRLRQLLERHDAARGAAVLKQTSRGRVTRISFDERGDAVCKEDRGGGLRSRLGGVFFGTRADRSQRAAALLMGAGFVVPEPLGLLKADGRTLYFARCVDGPTLSLALDEANPKEAHALALDAAAFTARLHDAGFAFRDLKPPNLVVAESGLVPVDLDDVSRPRRLPKRIAWRNLAALDAYGQRAARPLSVRARLAALRGYCSNRDLDPRAVLAPVLRLSRAKRQRWTKAQ